MADKLIPELINEANSMIPFLGFLLGIIAGYLQLRFTVAQLKTDYENKKKADEKTFLYFDESIKGVSKKINGVKEELGKEIGNKHIEVIKALSKIEGALSVLIPQSGMQPQKERGVD